MNINVGSCGIMAMPQPFLNFLSADQQNYKPSEWGPSMLKVFQFSILYCVLNGSFIVSLGIER